MSPAIRRASAADVPCVAPLFDAYRVFYRQPSDVAAASAFLRERIEREESVVYLAENPAGAHAAEGADAVEGAHTVEGADAASGTVVGFVQLYPLWSSTRTPPGRFWLLNDLFVAEPARRGGVARALMLRAERLARETGAVGLMLSTAVDNLRAQALYESAGYVRDTGFFTYERYF
jgi:ribosomal protein S18 acetylase RimI-like enzyme